MEIECHVLKFAFPHQHDFTNSDLTSIRSAQCVMCGSTVELVTGWDTHEHITVREGDELRDLGDPGQGFACGVETLHDELGVSVLLGQF